jgi:hypothetical protein
MLMMAASDRASQTIITPRRGERCLVWIIAWSSANRV